MNLNVLCNRLGVEIEPQLLELALTHRSYSYEHGNLPSNERLEFLGDSVLGFVVTAHIYETLTDLSEADLSTVKHAVVSARALATLATEIGLGNYLRLGKSAEKDGGRTTMNLLADAFEAVLGAIYISNGIDEAAEFVARWVFPLLSDVEGLLRNADPKAQLHKMFQAAAVEHPPYEIERQGPDHAIEFSATLTYEGKVIGQGTGRSKKLAETEAAISALANTDLVLPKRKKAK